MTSRPPPLGFVGLGATGRPMASHLAAAGPAATLDDVAPGLAQRVEPLTKTEITPAVTQ